MKILQISFENIGVFRDGVVIDMTAADRVMEPGHVMRLFGSIAKQNVIGLVGPNASGKTTLLKLIRFAIGIVVMNDGLDAACLSEGILQEDTVMSVDFFADDKLFRLQSTIGISHEPFEKVSYFFKEEVLFKKTRSSVKSKEQLFMFEDKHLFLKRSLMLKELMKRMRSSLLKPQDSIVLAVSQRDSICLDTFFTTNFNFVDARGPANMSFVNLFDDSIESLLTKDGETTIKFKHADHMIISKDLDAENFLSSGTIKGNRILMNILAVMNKGGYLIIDEMENHLHKKLVQVLIGLFNDECINKNGATLIFSTHYAEIMDCVDRKDNIFVITQNESHTSRVVRYSDVVARNDIKKSEVLLSNYIDGTSPQYDHIRQVREQLCALMK